MSSANKTPNIELNQWQGNEYPKRQDYVDDNVKIDTEIGNLKKIAHGAVADLAALKAIDTTNLTDNITIIVKSLGFYRFDSTSTLTSDDNAVVQPTTGPGRWINDLLSHKADNTAHLTPTEHTNVTNHLNDTTKHVTKDGVLQTGLNSEMVGGKKASDIVLKAQDLSYIGPNLMNGWQYINPGFGVRKDTLGYVHFHGGIFGGTITDGTIIGNVPWGYRPTEDIVVPAVNSDYSTPTIVYPCYVSIDGNGDMRIRGVKHNGNLRFDHLSYYTQQG